MSARFLAFEGIDGAGKSSHINLLGRWLHARGIKLIQTREPGGSALGDHLRSLLLTERMTREAETLLLFAARAEHLATLICPSLEAGTWVLSDRFSAASYAYQGAGRGLGQARIALLERWLYHDEAVLKPDLTFVFDLDPRSAAERMEGRVLDRFEQLDEAFFIRVRSAYLEMVRADPDHFCLLDAALPLTVIQETMQLRLQSLLPN